MTDCPHCEYNKQRAQNWREEAYRLAGHPLPERDPVLEEREACAKVCEKHAEVYASLPKTLTTDTSWAACIDNRDAIRARGQA